MRARPLSQASAVTCRSWAPSRSRRVGQRIRAARLASLRRCLPRPRLPCCLAAQREQVGAELGQTPDGVDVAGATANRHADAEPPAQPATARARRPGQRHSIRGGRPASRMHAMARRTRPTPDNRARPVPQGSRYRRPKRQQRHPPRGNPTDAEKLSMKAADRSTRTNCPRAGRTGRGQVSRRDQSERKNLSAGTYGRPVRRG